MKNILFIILLIMFNYNIDNTIVSNNTINDSTSIMFNLKTDSNKFKNDLLESALELDNDADTTKAEMYIKMD